MKRVIKKFFDGASSPQTAFFTVLLAVLGTWCAAAWMTLGSCLIDFSAPCKISPWFTGICCVFVVSAFFCNLAFFYTRVPEKLKTYFFPLCIMLALAVWGSCGFFGKQIGYYTFIAAFFWLLPLAVFHKDSHWVIPGSACWTFVFLGAQAFCELIVNYYKLVNLELTDILHSTSNVAFAGFFTVWGALFSLGKLYFRNENWKKILSRPALAVIAVFIISWCVMTGTACYEERTYQKNLVQAEDFFGFPLTAEGLQNIYYKEAPGNSAFWRNLEQLLEKFSKLTAERKQEDFITFPAGNFDKNSFEKWKNTFDTSLQFRKISGLCSQTFPPQMRVFKKYCLRWTILDELCLLRKLSRIQVWCIRFALENNDTAAALDALECISKSIDRLDKDHIVISHLFSHALLMKKKYAIELLLQKGKLDQQELKKQLDILTGKRKHLAAMERTALGGEITMLLDLQEGIWEGQTGFPALKKFRWFVPQCWYMIRQSCNMFIKS